ncbi:hypothetical protein RF11_08049 [Thelohanellus kitauei]|uniref:Transglutaminase-like domain-containing protein n=1 Tax=Thelohanellus kitauei TaxID=669202 RepID=A0A0C2MGP9_THEKT|nr:hypothetical protein RF11_08049 [Thelohanellus kitauei]
MSKISFSEDIGIGYYSAFPNSPHLIIYPNFTRLLATLVINKANNVLRPEFPQTTLFNLTGTRFIMYCKGTDETYLQTIQTVIVGGKITALNPPTETVCKRTEKIQKYGSLMDQIYLKLISLSRNRGFTKLWTYRSGFTAEELVGHSVPGDSPVWTKLWLACSCANDRAVKLSPFSNESLLVATKILDNLPFKKRSDPIHVMRLFSQWVNSNGRNGIIVGKWDKSKTQLSPFGSVNKCLRDYLINQPGPVCHGQCYSLNVTMCCLLRSIGIGCRIVTGRNILENPSLQFPIGPPRFLDINLFDIDNFYDTLYFIINKRKYHIWSNAFCRRDVLQDDTRIQDGWQFLDTSPINEKQGFIPFGPFPLKCLMNENISGIPHDGQKVKNLVKRYVWVYDPILGETPHKPIFLKIDDQMSTQCLDLYQIENVRQQHECRIPEYYEKIDKSIKFTIQAARNIRLGSTVDIVILCQTYSSTVEKMFFVEICANRRTPAFIRNIIYNKKTSNQSVIVNRIKFSINPHNKIWYSINPIEVLCNLYDPSIGFVKLVTHIMELKKFKMKIYTNIPITELNKDRKLKMEYENLLPIAILDISISMQAECEIFTRPLFLNVKPFEACDLIINAYMNVGFVN